MPAFFTKVSTAPTGLAFCQGCGLGTEAEGDLFYGEYNTGVIRDVTLDTTRQLVDSQFKAYVHTEGVLTMRASPSGGLYFSDSSSIYRLDIL